MPSKQARSPVGSADTLSWSRRKSTPAAAGRAAATPEMIHRIYVEPGVGLVPFQARELGFAMGLAGPQVSKLVKLMGSLYEAFVATDASMIEINPLVVTSHGDLLALDAKVNF